MGHGQVLLIMEKTYSTTVYFSALATFIFLPGHTPYSLITVFLLFLILTLYNSTERPHGAKTIPYSHKQINIPHHSMYNSLQ